MSKGNCINRQWVPGEGDPFDSINPATGSAIWSGTGSSGVQVDQAVRAAQSAFEPWAERPLDERIAILREYETVLNDRRESISQAIAEETGKPLWEAKTEAGAMAAKVQNAIDAYTERCPETRSEASGVESVLRYKPHGTVAVLGPFNLPGHLPNGHIVPALLAGNTVVFKPSELTPRAGELLMDCWMQTALPAGVLNLVQGARETGQALVGHPGIDGVFFTGSYSVGSVIHKAFGGHPEKILALEMGGNNPLVVDDVEHLEDAARTVIHSAYITSGQRCVCARRLYLPRTPTGDALLDRLTGWLPSIRTGVWTDSPEPYFGPVISRESADRVMKAYQGYVKAGFQPLVEMKQDASIPALLSPGLLLCPDDAHPKDDEIFGPLLIVKRTSGLDESIAEANRTAYGLSAGLISDSAEAYRRFVLKIRAGLVNWNRQITGASSRLPFGGTGRSGNHRPSGFFAADYCAYPVASLETTTVSGSAAPVPGIDS